MADDVQAPDPSQVMAGMPASMPNVGQASPQMPTLAPQQQQSQQATPPSPRPILLDLIQGLIKPQAQNLAASRPTSRTDVLENFLGNFVQALGAGFANEGRGPGAALRGAGAAMGAPWQAQQARQQAQAGIQQTQAEAGLTQARTQQLGQTVTLPNGMTVPFELAQKIAPALFGAQAKLGAADILAKGRTDSANIAGQARLESTKIAQGVTADVPQELQDKYGVPPKLPLAQLNKLESVENRPLTTVQGANGPSIVNKQTGQTKSLGLGAPAGGRYVPIVDPVTGLQTYRPAAQAAAQGSLAPGSKLDQVFKFKARMDDMDRVVGAMDSSIDALRQNDFQRGLMAKAFQAAENDPNALSTIVNSELFGQMTPKSQDFVVNNLAARENMQAAAQMLSQSGLSDARTRSVLNTLPVASDTPELATKKMIQVKGMLGNLKETMPQVRVIEQAMRAAQGGNSKKDNSGKRIIDLTK